MWSRNLKIIHKSSIFSFMLSPKRVNITISRFCLSAVSYLGVFFSSFGFLSSIWDSVFCPVYLGLGLSYKNQFTLSRSSDDDDVLLICDSSSRLFWQVYLLCIDERVMTYDLIYSNCLPCFNSNLYMFSWHSHLLCFILNHLPSLSELIGWWELVNVYLLSVAFRSVM